MDGGESKMLKMLSSLLINAVKDMKTMALSEGKKLVQNWLLESDGSGNGTFPVLSLRCSNM